MRQSGPANGEQVWAMRNVDLHPSRQFFLGVVISAVLIVLKGFVESGEFGKQLEQMTYNLLQLRLLSRGSSVDLPVAIVDITDVAATAVEYGGKSEFITPRGPLGDIVQAIAEQQPRAIGIDLDFSPGEHGYLTASDPDLLRSFLEIRRRGIPVYVGIFDSVVLDPARWLGRPDFTPLAAYITVPAPEHTEPSIRMVEWVQPKGVSAACYSLAYLLAETRHTPVPLPLRWAVRRATVRQENEFAASEFLVDFGSLDSLVSQRLIAGTADAVTRHGTQLKDRIVLVGRASPGRTTDQFNVPGRGVPLPGVYLHAAATYTLLQAPLYRLTHGGRIAADALTALLAFGPVALVGARVRRGGRSPATAHRLHLALTAVVVVAVLLVGQVLVHRIRLIWTDYLMVIGALLLHAPIERQFGRAIQWSRGALRGRLVRRHTPDAEDDEEPIRRQDSEEA